MDTEWKERWITALRSGEYEQGRGALRDQGDQYCCLGVLCDISKGAVEGDLNWEPIDSSLHEDIYAIAGSTGYLPAVIAETVRLDQSDMEELVDMNDADYASFEEIADYVEANL